jgi:hypothetical protein
MIMVEKVKQLLVDSADNLPMDVEEFEKMLNNVGCVWNNTFDHGDYVSDVINKECYEDEDEEEEDYCNMYSVTRYKIAWFGFTCGEHKIVAVLRDLVVIEMNGVLHTIAHYDVLNVVENEKLYNIIKEKIVATEIGRRKLMELTETMTKAAPKIMKAFISLAMIGAVLKSFEKALEESAKEDLSEAYEGM